MRAAFALSLLLCAGCQPDAAPSAQGAQSSANARDEAAAPIAKGRFAPRNTCGRLPGADAFRAELIEAVTLRDADAVVAMADPAIKLDFGGGGGVQELRKRLGAGTELWPSLDQMLKLGCAVGDRGGMVIPWLFAQDLGAIDPTAAMLVLGEDVPVLAEPRASSDAIATVSWDFVNAVSLEPGKPFQRVALPVVGQGFVATDKLRSVLDYRLLASRTQDGWRIEALVAGD